VGRTQTAIGRLRNLAFRERTLDAFQFTDRDLADVVSTIQRWRPQVIVGYASMIVHLADYVAERGFRGVPAAQASAAPVPPVEGIISSADMLLPHQRAHIEDVLRAPVFDRYGCREVDTIAAECDRHQGLHVNVDRLVVEYLDEAGRPVLFGQPGRVVVTDLFNYAMPFIRYDVGDLATPAGALCDCGRGLPLLDELVGRFADVLTTPEGAYVSVSALATILAQVKGLRECQFVQRAVDRLVVRVVPRSDYTAKSEGVFRQRLAELFSARMQVTFEYVDTIPKTSSGKARLSVADISSYS
jgi:phenylacetate-CoA ligase